MTITTEPLVLRRRSLPRRLTNDEVAEFDRVTASLPYVTTGSWSPSLPIGMPEAAMHLQAAVWDVARRLDVCVCADWSLLDVADELHRNGWSTGPARDALRALAMLQGAGEAMSEDIRVLRSVARLIGYFELRARIG